MSATSKNHVGAGTAIAVIYRLLLGQLLTTGRAIGLGLFGAVLAVVAWAVERSESSDAMLELAARRESAAILLALLGLGAVVPIVTLAFSGGALGDLRDDQTLVYLWLRPMDRWPIVVGAVLAGITVSIPFATLPVVVAAAVLNVGSQMVVAALLTSLVGVVAYAAVFVLLGLVVRNSIVWGLAYVIVWEGVAATFGNLPARLSIRGYTTSILSDQTSVDLEFADLAQSSAFAVLALITVAAVVLATRRLRRIEVP